MADQDGLAEEAPRPPKPRAKRVKPIAPSRLIRSIGRKLAEDVAVPRAKDTRGGEPLSERKRRELFAAWVTRQSVLYVARACAVSPVTVRRYRLEDRWAERLPKVLAKAREIADYELQDALAENVLIARAMKRRLAKLIDTASEEDITLADLPRSVKIAVELEMLMMGGPTARIEHEAGATWMELMEAASARVAEPGGRRPQGPA